MTSHPRQKKFFWSLFFLFFILLALISIALKVGHIPVSWKGVFKSLLAWQENILVRDIIFYIRLPRMLAALLVGAILALGGVIAQTTLRNDLAEPYLLGISSGAAFGAALAISIGFPYIEVVAIGFSLAALLLVLSVGFKRSKNSVLNIILAGVMINAIFTSGVMFMIYMNPTSKNILFWLLGDLSYLPLNSLRYMGLFFLVVLILFLRFSKGLDLFVMGEEEIKTLGFSPRMLRIVFLSLSSTLVAVAVSYVGIIGFIGLVVPHLAKMVLGTGHRFLIPVSVLGGAALLLAADIISRSPIWTQVLPIGIITSLLGAPFFLLLLLRQKKYA